jgi:hypothetical protein
VDDTYRMIRDAGFEIEGNPLYNAEAAKEASSFRLEGDDPIIKPDIARSA